MADEVTLTLRVHDAKEKRDPTLSACWAVVKVPREDLQMKVADFCTKHIVPALKQIKNLKLS